MSRIGGATAPVKCEENPRTPIEIKQEQCDVEDTYGESHATLPADSSVGQPSSSSLTAAETDNSYEFLGNMKYEADESTDSTTTADPLSTKKHDICPLCHQVYYKKARYGYHRKREFITHLIRVHDYSHLRGYRHLAQCKGCKIKRERWSFVVVEGNNYKFSDVCSRCEGYTCRPITDESDGPQYRLIKNQHRQSMTSVWKNFMAQHDLNAELEERPEAKAETPTAAEEPSLQADESTDSTSAGPASSKKRDGSVCHLCQQVYYRKICNGNKKRYFIDHLVKAHDYHHLRGHHGRARCTVCGDEKKRWTFVVCEADNYKFSDKCSTCQGNNRSGAWVASPWKNSMDHQELNAELQESPEATTPETPSASDEPVPSEAHPLPQQ